MPNERLRAALLERGMTPAKLAEALEVDTKTVERSHTRVRVNQQKCTAKLVSEPVKFRTDPAG